ncbi:hypothetical protein M9991_17430 [Chryseobacterium gallinarum]|uniref:hypothetical protein n=1 Tax=Chryseobacterium gallinarum TaxID=1324352 RepID=UPI00202443A9|nr:hypothetical protein [Chryseobacterium gallinarum]MCL8538652.1 hypothetical protein [Chryseobacterium gallinarum]
MESTITPKGRIIIIRGNDKETDEESEGRLTPYDLLLKILTRSSEQKTVRIEILTTSDHLENGGKDAALKKEGYNNIGCIFLREKEDLGIYYSRISEAKIIVFDNPHFSEILKDSSIPDLLVKKYLHEENFTIAGINAGGMYLPGLVLHDKGNLVTGLGLVNNCIIDTKFRHGTRFTYLVDAVIQHQECLAIGINAGMAFIIEKGYRASCMGNSSVMVVNARNVNNKCAKKRTSVYKKNLRGHILTEGSVFDLFSGERIKKPLLPDTLNFIKRNAIQ